MEPTRLPPLGERALVSRFRGYGMVVVPAAPRRRPPGLRLGQAGLPFAHRMKERIPSHRAALLELVGGSLFSSLAMTTTQTGRGTS